jgi:hypothetical protein
MPGLPPGRLPADHSYPVLPRNDFGAGLASPSDDGGLEEFRLFWPSYARSSAFSTRNAATSARSSTTSAASSSYDGSSADTPDRQSSNQDQIRQPLAS